MVHVLLLRCCNSLVQTSNAVYGVHEQIEQSIHQRKYKVEGKLREGYNIPFGSQWIMMDYRMKKEAVADFAADLEVRNLNPYPNNIKFHQIFMKKANNFNAMVNMPFKLIQWCFKWINRKKTTATILIALGILLASPFLILCSLLIIVNPLKPIPVSDKSPERFCKPWYYHFTIGYLEDPVVEVSKNETQEDVL